MASTSDASTAQVYPCKWNGPGTIRGAALVMNYEFRGKVNLERIGSEKDMERVTKALEMHGYKVRAHTDLSYQTTEDVLKEFIEDSIHGEDGTDSTVVVIMSHGDMAHEIRGSVFQTYDEIFMASQPIVDKFQHVPGLEGKPKLFFFNFCRGDLPQPHLSTEALKNMMKGYFESEAQFWSDEDAVRKTIPANRIGRHFNDTLVVYSTLARFASLRDRDHGSWFIQDLCEVLEDEQQFATKDVVQLLNEVDQKLKVRAEEVKQYPRLMYGTQTCDIRCKGLNKKFYF